ncbi:MAG: LLM class flavin-dependent oxidoreductase [Pseudomonadota bacterium]
MLAAKMLSTVDVLSDGRLTIGVGAGWLKDEFDAVVTTPFAERGAVTDEYLQAFRLLWTENTPKLDGRYVKIDNIVFEPKPVQKPHPPIWVGGGERAEHAPRRALRRRLVSDRQQPEEPARHAAALSRPVSRGCASSSPRPGAAPTTSSCPIGSSNMAASCRTRRPTASAGCSRAAMPTSSAT